MAFKQILILLVIDKIFLTESLFSKYRWKNQDFGLTSLTSNISETGETFTQKLDHFNPTDTRTWTQVYYRNQSFYNKGGPAYLYIGGEGQLNPEGLQDETYWQEHGKKNHALLFAMEHRFYGLSQPFRDASTDNLRYLSTPQALADLATFIVSMNEKHKLSEDTKWIVFGGSYAGNLAAWMRLKYPHLVHGAVASSAPILAQKNFPEYLDVVSDALVAYKKKCRDDIFIANQQLMKDVRTSQGRRKIGKIFNLCEQLDGEKLNTAYFFSNIADLFSGIVQYDDNKRAVKKVCDKMLEDGNKSKLLERYAKVINDLLQTEDDKCLHTDFKNCTALLKRDDLNSSAETDRPWLYQTCTEYGYFQTSETVNSLFSKSISIDLHEALCTEAYNKSFNKSFIENAVNATNTFFGGLNFNSPRTVFVHGLLDPWHRLGITSSDKTKNYNVILIKGGSHCNDLSSPDENDSDEVKKARAEIVKLMDEWLKEPK